jgi:hypothetical protein
MSATFPNVPDAPGVPPVQRSDAEPADQMPMDAQDGSGDEAGADMARQWGLYTQDGDLAAPADNVVSLELDIETRISDYPVAPNNDTPQQTIGFASYNKVIVPYDIRLIMSKGGSVEDRQAFLGAIQDASQSTTLYDVITPECVYLDVNVVGVRMMRSADRGAGLLTLEVALRNVRQTAKLSFTNTAQPSGNSPVNNGSVQAQPAPTTEVAH